MSGAAAPLARWRERAIAHALFGMRTALEAVRHNKLRAFLTSLGIMFGVASVIAMLAIGKGAEQEVLEQMRLLGSNNIVITPLVEQEEEAVTDEPTRQVVARQLTALVEWTRRLRGSGGVTPPVLKKN